MKKVTIFLTIIVLVCLYSMSSAQIKYYTKPDFFACISENYLDTLVSVINDRDKEAINKMIYNKECFILKPGMPCFIMDTRWPGTVKIRMEGSTTGIWTVKEAIREATTSDKKEEAPKPKPVDKLPKDQKAKVKADCYEIGYRYGDGAARAVAGLDYEKNLVIPPKCRNRAETNRGYNAGYESVKIRYGK